MLSFLYLHAEELEQETTNDSGHDEAKCIHEDQVTVLSQVHLFCMDFSGRGSRDSDTDLQHWRHTAECICENCCGTHVWGNLVDILQSVHSLSFNYVEFIHDGLVYFGLSFTKLAYIL